jgi:hypothetical protein
MQRGQNATNACDMSLVDKGENVENSSNFPVDGSMPWTRAKRKPSPRARAYLVWTGCLKSPMPVTAGEVVSDARLSTKALVLFFLGEIGDFLPLPIIFSYRDCYQHSVNMKFRGHSKA